MGFVFVFVFLGGGGWFLVFFFGFCCFRRFFVCLVFFPLFLFFILAVLQWKSFPDIFLLKHFYIKLTAHTNKMWFNFWGSLNCIILNELKSLVKHFFNNATISFFQLYQIIACENILILMLRRFFFLLRFLLSRQNCSLNTRWILTTPTCLKQNN